MSHLPHYDKKYKQLFPNSVTMLGLAFGFSSLNMAYWGQWKMALLFILLAAIFDFLDGKVARLLGVTSRFGMELDSLSDFISFGVSPGFLMYQWTLNPELKLKVLGEMSNRSDAIGIGWGIVLFMVLCCATRLARFNTTSDDNRPEYWKPYFTGVPAPAGAAITTFPLMLWLATQGECPLFREPIFVRVFLIFSGIMMASKIPTIALKHFHLPDKSLSVFRLIILGLIAGLFCLPWWVLSFASFIYMITIPVGCYYFAKSKKEYLQKHKSSLNNESFDGVPNNCNDCNNDSICDGNSNNGDGSNKNCNSSNNSNSDNSNSDNSNDSNNEQ